MTEFIIIKGRLQTRAVASLNQIERAKIRTLKVSIVIGMYH